VTGLGLVTPLAAGVEKAWQLLTQGKSGVRQLTREDVTEDAQDKFDRLSVKIGGCVPQEDLEAHDYPKNLPRNLKFAQIAAKEALSQASWFPDGDWDRRRTGVSVGAGMGYPSTFYTVSNLIGAGKERRVSPYFIPHVLSNMPSGVISIENGFRGPNHSVATACASGAHCIGDAFRMIHHGEADVMVAGGSEACVDILSLTGFARMKALASGYNDSPRLASRPFDKQRCGFVIGEGAGILVLEELEHAKKRRAKILSEIVGYGRSGDAHHMTQPSKTGSGAYQCMEAALRDSGLCAGDVGYINAHATSTPLGDKIEQEAIASLFGKAGLKTPWVSSTKGSVGHLLGAAGAVEAVFTILSLVTGQLPPNQNLEETDVPGKVKLVSNEGMRKDDLQVAMTNSFGFGGTNCSLVFAN
jgi:3-oxoacyl-[acyl-carrier-protein] synthase II